MQIAMDSKDKLQTGLQGWAVGCARVSRLLTTSGMRVHATWGPLFRPDLYVNLVAKMMLQIILTCSERIS